MYKTLGVTSLNGVEIVPGSLKRMWAEQHGNSGPGSEVRINDFDVQLPTPVKVGMESKSPIVTISILTNTSRDLPVHAYLKYDCQAYAMGTVDPVTGRGFLPRLACLYNILNDERIALTINTTTPISRPLRTSGDQYGPITRGDVLIFWKKLDAKPEVDVGLGPAAEFLTMWVGVHASVITDDNLAAQTTLGPGTRLTTKNGDAEVADMTLGAVLEKYKDNTTHMGVYRMVPAAQEVFRRSWSGIQYE